MLIELVKTQQNSAYYAKNYAGIIGQLLGLIKSAIYENFNFEY